MSGWRARSRRVAPRACTSSCRSTIDAPLRGRGRRHPGDRGPRRAPRSAIATTAFIKEDRGGKVFVDSTRVGGATVVAAYSPRVRPGAPVSFPVGWDELDDGLARRLHGAHGAGRDSATRDPWAAQMPAPQRLRRRAHRGGPRDPRRSRPGHARRQAPQTSRRQLSRDSAAAGPTPSEWGHGLRMPRNRL